MRPFRLYAFEHYDPLGAWRDTDNGSAIDSSGELLHSDLTGKFADAIELTQRMAESHDARACYVSRWLENAYRRPATPEDACALQNLAQDFDARDGKIVELLVAVAKTDNFRYRLRSELAP